MAQANVTMIEAQMGEGKTLTATAVIADDYFAEVKAIRTRKEELCRYVPKDAIPFANIVRWDSSGHPVTCTFDWPVEPHLLDKVGLVPWKIFTVRGGGQLWRVRAYDENHADMIVNHGLPQNRRKIVQVPKSCIAISDVKIFANYHLFGMEYVYSDPAMMLAFLNTGMISNGKMIIDEAYISGEARRGQNSLSLVTTWFAQQMRKRDIELYMLVQHGRFIDWRLRYIAKRKILCRYNDKTHRIKLLIQNLGKGTEKFTSYYAPQYWKFYDTNELPPVPEKMIAKAGGWAG